MKNLSIDDLKYMIKNTKKLLKWYYHKKIYKTWKLINKNKKKKFSSV